MTTSDPPLLTRAEPLPLSLDPAIVLVDKPGGMSSFDVIRRMRRRFGIKKMGHAGTLDPMATGLLIILIGRSATRLQDRFMGLPKRYTGTMRLGETTASYDAESDILERRDASGVTDEALEEAREAFTGDLLQVPPAYSAIKVGGERLYKKARRGETVEPEPRAVTIHDLAWTARREADVDFDMGCSKGTYVRSLAHDVGERLGVGAHLTALRRTAIGPFTVEEAWPLDALLDAPDPANA